LYAELTAVVAMTSSAGTVWADAYRGEMRGEKVGIVDSASAGSVCPTTVRLELVVKADNPLNQALLGQPG
jgi:hypothetical protein